MLFKISSHLAILMPRSCLKLKRKGGLGDTDVKLIERRRIENEEFSKVICVSIILCISLYQDKSFFIRIIMSKY